MTPRKDADILAEEKAEVVESLITLPEALPQYEVAKEAEEKDWGDPRLETLTRGLLLHNEIRVHRHPEAVPDRAAITSKVNVVEAKDAPGRTLHLVTALVGRGSAKMETIGAKSEQGKTTRLGEALDRPT